MNRLGWIILVLILVVCGAFALMLRPGSAPRADREFTVVETAPDASLMMPVAGIAPEQLVDTWGQARAGGVRAHDAIDIMAPRGSLVVAAAPGTVEKLFESHDGGHTVYIRSPDGGTVTYYAHLDAYQPGLSEGQRVEAGQAIATVGSTGNASPEGPHLHFEVKRMGPGEKWYQGRAENPYPLLAARAPGR